MPKRNLVGTLFFILLFMIFAGVLFLRVSVQRLLESSELNRIMQTSTSGLISRWNPEIQIELARVRVNGFLDLELSPIKVIPVSGQEPYILHLKASIEGFTSLIWGGSLRFLAVLGTKPDDDSRSAIIVKSTLSPADFYGLLTAWEPGEFQSQLRRIFLGKTFVQMRFLGPQWLDLVITEKNLGLKPKMISGELSGEFQISQMDSPVALKMDLSSAEWESPRFDKFLLKTDPLRLEAQWDGNTLKFQNPFTITLSLVLKGAAVSLQNNLLLAGKDGLLDKPWSITLAGEMVRKDETMNYALQGLVKGSPLALMAAGRLLRCKTPPLRNSFNITGPITQPECL
jgi:hypothetical protein